MRALRIPLHCCLLALLVAGAGWLWKNVWQASKVAAPIRLAPGPRPPGHTLGGADGVIWDATRGAIILRGNETGPMPGHEIPLSAWPRGMAAHIRFAGQAREIVPGIEDWQDGRIMVIWRDDEGRILRHHHGLLGAKGSGEFSLEYVAVLKQPGRASVFLQHAGKRGELTIDHLEITLVGLHPWARAATGALLIATGLWWGILFRALAGKGPPWRPFGASLLALVAVWTLVLPGPWEPLRPLGGSFAIGEVAHGPPAGAESGQVEARPVNHGAMEAPAPAPANTAVGPAELAVPGALDQGWFLETYLWVKNKARTLMHLGVFAALTVAFVGILGSNRGWIPVAVLGLASEAMQTLFGFGFEWEDAGDLAVNALGIIAGLMALNAWQKRRSRRQGERAITSPLCR